MKGSPHPAVRAADLPGVRALREAPRPAASAGLDRALAVLFTFGAPPALVLSGLWVRGTGVDGSPGAFWLAACAFFFTGLVLSLRLRPLPPRRILPARDVDAPTEIPMRPIFPDAAPTEAFGLRSEMSETLGIHPEMSRCEILEQLAKLRERGDLSGGEYARVRRELVGD
jgi:hypothetical protein